MAIGIFRVHWHVCDPFPTPEMLIGFIRLSSGT
jgi:hypothetical protein